MEKFFTEVMDKLEIWEEKSSKRKVCITKKYTADISRLSIRIKQKNGCRRGRRNIMVRNLNEKDSFGEICKEFVQLSTGLK